MLLQPVNELTIKLELEAISPLIIKEARFGDDQRRAIFPDQEQRAGLPNAIPISRASYSDIEKAMRNPDPLREVNNLPFFIPGSSMRGAWRAHLERTLRAFDKPEMPRVCDPLEDTPGAVGLSCSTALTARRDALSRDPTKRVTLAPYSASCPVCRVFGSTLQGSRLAVGDGIRDPRDRTDPSRRLVARQHVRIDRRTGAVKHRSAPLTFFGLQGARFNVDIRLRNFEIGHIVLVSMLLAELRNESLPLGFGKSKGYGRVKGTAKEILLTIYGLEQPDDVLRGIAEDPRVGPWVCQKYQLARLPEGDLPRFSGGEWSAPTDAFWRHQRSIAPAEFGALGNHVLKPWLRQWRDVSLLSKRAQAGSAV